jgi:hypothetical protein
MLDTDGPVIGEDPAWVVRDFPHVAIGVGEGSGHAAQRGACRRPYDLPAGLLGLGKYYRDLFGGSNIMCEFYAGRAVAPELRPEPQDHAACLEEADLLVRLLCAVPAHRLIKRSVYRASACHRVAVLAKSPLTQVRTPDDDVQLPFIDLGSERDRSLGAELFGRVSGDHDNLCQRQPKIDQLTRTRLAARDQYSVAVDNLPLHGLTEASRFPQTTTVSWKRVDQDLPNWSSSNRATVSGASRCGKCPTPSSTIRL